MTSTSSSSPAAPRRNPILVTIDIVVSVLLLMVSGALAVTVIANARAYGDITASCGLGPYTGLECNATVLAIVVYGLIGIAVLAAFIGFGMVLVSLIRRRYAFWWPLGSIVLTIAIFWVATWLASLTVPSV
jgi:hypothetical protein